MGLSIGADNEEYIQYVSVRFRTVYESGQKRSPSSLRSQGVVERSRVPRSCSDIDGMGVDKNYGTCASLCVAALATQLATSEGDACPPARYARRGL